jgi:Flp pilus assembly protein TadD
MQMNRGNFKDAVVSMRKAHELAPDNPEFAYRLGLALQASGDLAQSQVLLRDLVRRGGFNELEAAKNLLANQLKMAGQTQFGR